MINILDHVAQSSARRFVGRFEPATTRDVFALSLARKLDDAAGVGHYARLCLEYPTEHLLHVFRDVTKTTSDQPLYRLFNDALKTARQHGPGNGRPKFCAVRVERRAVAVAVMHSESPEYMRVRQLSSDPQKALTSAAYFLNKVLDEFPVTMAAVELVPNGHDHQRLQLIRLVSMILRQRAISITEIGKRTIFESLGHPPVKSRKAVRQIIERIYQFETFAGYGAPFLKDALALGLHTHTERLFIN